MTGQRQPYTDAEVKQLQDEIASLERELNKYKNSTKESQDAIKRDKKLVDEAESLKLPDLAARLEHPEIKADVECTSDTMLNAVANVAKYHHINALLGMPENQEEVVKLAKSFPPVEDCKKSLKLARDELEPICNHERYGIITRLEKAEVKDQTGNFVNPIAAEWAKNFREAVKAYPAPFTFDGDMAKLSFKEDKVSKIEPKATKKPGTD